MRFKDLVNKADGLARSCHYSFNDLNKNTPRESVSLSPSPPPPPRPPALPHLRSKLGAADPHGPVHPQEPPHGELQGGGHGPGVGELH